MFALRSLSRSVSAAPLSRIATRSYAASPAIRSALRPAAAGFARQNSGITSSLPMTSSFSTSASALNKKIGQVDVELATKFEEELGFEIDPAHSQDTTYIKEYLESSPFKLIDTPGKDEVVMTREFGNENIKLTFSIDDLKTASEEPEVDESLPDEYDEELSEQHASQPPAAHKQDRKQSAENSEDEEALEDMRASFPARVSVLIEKAGKGAVHVDVLARDGLIQVDDVAYYPQAELADPKNSEQEWERQSRYTGPPFGNLDEDLQVIVERYLDERGIDAGLAAFIPEYMEHKEQREYVDWLKNFRDFVDA